jgi:hypothetical protein
MTERSRPSDPRAGNPFWAFPPPDPAREEAKRRLWQLSRDQRVQAMRAGRMPLWLCLHWASRAPHEVPLIGNEWEFIATFTPEVAEVDDAQPSQRERVTESLIRCRGQDESPRG